MIDEGYDYEDRLKWENTRLVSENAKLKSRLEGLLIASRYMRDNAAFDEKGFSHRVSQSIWSGWCKQIKFVERAEKSDE